MFDKENLDLIDFLFEPFDWDKKEYSFNRKEKDMHPYSSLTNEDKSITIVHNVLGIDKKDLKVIRKNENGTSYIVITGETVDEITKQKYTVNSKFAIDEKILDLSKAKSTAKNGLIYITIPTKEVKPDVEEDIEIL